MAEAPKSRGRNSIFPIFSLIVPLALLAFLVFRGAKEAPESTGETVAEEQQVPLPHQEHQPQADDISLTEQAVSKAPDLARRTQAGPQPSQTPRVNHAEPPTRIQRGPNQEYRPALPQVAKPAEERRDRLFEKPIFTVRPEVTGPLTFNAHTRRAIEVAFDPVAFDEFLDSGDGRIRLPLTEDQEVEIEIEQMVSRGPETVSLIGEVADLEEESDVILVFHDGIVHGTVAMPESGEHFEMVVAGNGDLAVRELDPETYTARCGNTPLEDLVAADLADTVDPNPEVYDPNAEGLFEAPPAIAFAQSSSGGGPSTTVMDIVVGYSALARSNEGGVAAMEARIVATIDRLNDAFTNSSVNNHQVVLLGMVEDPLYTDPGDDADVMGSADELGHLNTLGDGELDTVTDLRDSTGADSAAFVVNNTQGGSAGVAYRPGRSMLVARTYMSSFRLTFAHEYGHNLGLRHGWADDSATGPKDVYNYGWRFRTDAGSQVRTIMAYDWGWTRIVHFSNPAVNYGGNPTGAVDGYDATGNSDVDSRLVNGGLIGGAGAGYDGTNPDLGARNADYILANSATMANRAVRTGPRLSVQEPDLDGVLVRSETSLLFSGTSTVSKVLTLENVGTATLNNLSASLSGADSAFFSVGSPGTNSLAIGASTTITVTYLGSGSGPRTANLDFLSNDIEGTFTVPLKGAGFSTVASQDFETSISPWTNVPLDFNWTRDSSGTPSSDTGPSSAQQGNWYVYLEATSPDEGDECAVETVIDLTGQTNSTLSFLYHMHGSEMGTLHVDLHDGTSWQTSYWCKEAEQHEDETSPWALATVDLSSFDGLSAVTLRFRGVTGSSFRSDIAFDAVEVIALSGDDHGNSLTTATDVTSTIDGTGTAGDLEAAGDEDWFKFTLSGSHRVIIGTTGAADTEGSLYDGTGALIASDTNSGANGIHFEIEEQLTAGTYYVQVTGAGGTSTGTYQLDLSTNDSLSITDPSETMSGWPATKAFTVLSNATWTWTSSATWATSSTPSPSTGNRGFVYVLAANTTGSTRTATITFSTSSGNTVNHVVTQLTQDDHGDNTSIATDVTADVSTGTPGAAVPGTGVAGVVEATSDRDWFTFTVTSPVLAIIETTGNTDTSGWLYDGTTLLAFDTQDNGNFRLVEELFPGTYLVQVRSGITGATGPYELHIQLDSGVVFNSNPNWVPTDPDLEIDPTADEFTTGWVYVDWPHVYDPAQSKWLAFDETGQTSWHLDMTTYEWADLSDSSDSTGWLYFYSSDHFYDWEEQNWHFYDKDNTQEVIDPISGVATPFVGFP